jgi:hypothetical protein
MYDFIYFKYYQFSLFQKDMHPFFDSNLNVPFYATLLFSIIELSNMFTFLIYFNIIDNSKIDGFYIYFVLLPLLGLNYLYFLRRKKWKSIIKKYTENEPKFYVIYSTGVVIYTILSLYLFIIT